MATERQIDSADVTGALGFSPLSTLAGADASLATVNRPGSSAVTLAQLAAGTQGALQAAGGNAGATVVVPPGASTARTLASMFGDTLNGVSFGMDPSGVQDSTGAFVALIAAFNATGKPVFIPAGTYQITGPLTLDFTAGRTVGGSIRGAGGQATRLLIANSTTSPALTLCATGGAVFYLEFGDLAVASSCAAPVLAIGRNRGNPASGQPNYPDAFNSSRFHGLVVNNNMASAAAQGIQVNGLYQSEIEAVANCKPGFGTSLRLNMVQFSAIKGSFSTAHLGIEMAEFYSFANRFEILDLEVVDVGLRISSTYAHANIFEAVQVVVTNGVTPTFCIDGQAGSGNVFEAWNLVGTRYGGTTGLVLRGDSVGTETIGGLVASSLTTAALAVTGNATVGGTLAVTGNVSAASPTSAGHLATKGYVDGSIGIPFSHPAGSAFQQLNMPAGAVLTDHSGGPLSLTLKSGGTNDNVAQIGLALPPAPYTISARLGLQGTNSNYYWGYLGIGVPGGLMVALMHAGSSMTVNIYTNPTTYGGRATNISGSQGASVFSTPGASEAWLYIRDDGTLLHFGFSYENRMQPFDICWCLTAPRACFNGNPASLALWGGNANDQSGTNAQVIVQMVNWSITAG